MAKFHIILQPEICIGCGACVAICPARLKMGSDGKSHLIGGKVVKQNELKSPGVTFNEILDIDDVGCLRDAADCCPVQVLVIQEKKK